MAKKPSKKSNPIKGKKRFQIDLDLEAVVPALQKKADLDGRDLKPYMEQVLIRDSRK